MFNNITTKNELINFINNHKSRYYDASSLIKIINKNSFENLNLDFFQFLIIHNISKYHTLIFYKLYLNEKKEIFNKFKFLEFTSFNNEEIVNINIYLLTLGFNEEQVRYLNSATYYSDELIEFIEKTKEFKDRNENPIALTSLCYKIKYYFYIYLEIHDSKQIFLTSIRIKNIFDLNPIQIKLLINLISDIYDNKVELEKLLNKLSIISFDNLVEVIDNFNYTYYLNDNTQDVIDAIYSK